MQTPGDSSAGHKKEHYIAPAVNIGRRFFAALRGALLSAALGFPLCVWGVDEPAAPVAEPAPALPAAAPIPDPETALTTALGARLPASEVQWLSVDGRQVLALFRTALGAGDRAVLLLHERGAHADYPGPINTLRHGLSRQGWATLSLQLPVPAPQAATADDVSYLDGSKARVQAGLEWLRSKGAKRIVLIGHGLGAAVAADLLGNAAPPLTGVVGFVGVSMAAYVERDPRLNIPQSLAKIRLPVFDIYGARDLPIVRDTAPKRFQAAIMAGFLISGAVPAAAVTTPSASPSPSPNERQLTYRQLAIPGADHAFTGQETPLLKHVAGWIKRHLLNEPAPSSNALRTSP